MYWVKNSMPKYIYFYVKKKIGFNEKKWKKVFEINNMNEQRTIRFIIREKSFVLFWIFYNLRDVSFRYWYSNISNIEYHWKVCFVWHPSRKISPSILFIILKLYIKYIVVCMSYICKRVFSQQLYPIIEHLIGKVLP